MSGLASLERLRNGMTQLATERLGEYGLRAPIDATL
jgi:hypothetical protein